MNNRPDPRLIARPADFARSLRLLRAQSGLSIRALAGDLQTRWPGAPSFTTLGGWFSGSHLPTPKLVRVVPELLAACGETGPAEVAEWLAALERVRCPPGPRPAGSLSPFRGLAAYEPEHAQYFCGRDALIADLLAVTAQQRASGGPVIVVGPSGSGKSSLLRAGLIPALVSGRCESATSSWHYLLFTPGSNPLCELARHLADFTGTSPAAAEADLLADPTSAAEMIRCAVARRAGDTTCRDRLLIVVDQFEELFTAEVSEARKNVFIQALCAATRPPAEPAAVAPPALVVLGLRADFYARALLVAELVPALQNAQLVVGPMTEHELRQAITEPTRKAHLGIEDGLVELLMRELTPPSGGTPGAAHDSGALPLLSHALLATWAHARARTLTVEHYRAAGGIRGAVANTAEAAFAALPPPQQEIARRLFVRLVRTGDDIADTRRKVRRAELLGANAGPEVDHLQEVLDQFINARLITADDHMVEITHEALLTAWPRLGTWLGTDRRWLDMHRRLTAAARNWADTGRDPDGLYRGGMLHVLHEQAADHDRSQELNALEREFLGASLAWEAGEQRKARRRTRRRYQVTALLTVLAVVAVSVVAYARQLQLTSSRDQAQALSRLVASKSDRLRGQDVSLSTQLALAAYRIAPTPEARSSVLNSTDVPAATRLPDADGSASAIAVSRHGSLIATGTTLGAVQLWRVPANGHFIRAGLPLKWDSGPVISLAFSPDGRNLAVTGGKALYLWDTSNPAQPVGRGKLTGASGEIASVAISPDGRTLAAGSSDDKVYLWNISDPAHPALQTELTGPALPVTSVAFTPDGRTLAAGSKDARVYLWNITDPTHPALRNTLTGPASEIFSLAISPNGRYLAAGTGAQHSVYLWNIHDAARALLAGPPLTGPASWVNAVAFSPDGQTLAAGSSDSELWLFDLATRKAAGQLPHPNPVTAVAYLNNESLVTVSNDATNGTARLWDVPGPIITGAKDAVFAVSFDAPGTKLGVGPGSQDNNLTVWNPTDIKHPVELGPPLANSPHDSKFSGSGALTPDGRTFVVGCANGSVQLWDISNTAHPARLGPPIQAATALVESVTISHNGQMLAVSSDDGAVHLWDIADRQHPYLLADLRPPAPGYIYQATFNRDGNLLAAASANAKVYLWTIANDRHPRLLATLAGFTEPAYSTVFTRNGHVLAASGANDTVRLWDITRPNHPAALATLTGPVANIYSLTYTPGKDILAAGSTDGTIWLWNLADPRHPAYLATLTGPAKGILAVAFSPNGHTLAAGSEDGTVHLWNTDPKTAATWICATTGQPITRQEWHQFIPALPYAPPCK
jgi:WD40 repeat protein